MKALVVDDSATMRKIIGGALAKTGEVSITEAANGEEAVAQAKANDFDIILMDWNMPRMLGIDALKDIRALGKKTPIIMVTTEAEKVRVIEALKAGANNYMIKPFAPEMLVQKVQETIAKATGRA